MCGIAGVIARAGTAVDRVPFQLVGRSEKRADSDGVWSDQNLRRLAHRRLSIIDLSERPQMVSTWQLCAFIQRRNIQFSTSTQASRGRAN